MKDGSIVIAGAGIAGLTLAAKLLEGGVSNPVVVVEKLDRVGGLARSFSYNGFTFDIGPHRFHSDDRAVMEFVLDVLGDDHIEIRRSSAVWMFDRYFDWPLKPSTVFRLPFSLMFRSSLDLLRRKKATDDSFESFIIERYGKALYLVFFKPYTEKFLKYSCSQLHADWAKTGINRAVIDKRVKADTLFDVARSVLLPKPVDTRFVYPKSGGNGLFCQYLEQRIRRLGGRVCLSSTITATHRSQGAVDRVVLNGSEEIETRFVFWSAPIGDLLSALDLTEGLPRVEYLATVLANYMIDAPVEQHYQWCYFGTEESPVCRVSSPTEFNPALAPEGRSGLCVELSCMEGDGVWQHPERMDAVVEQFLVRSKLVARYNDFLDVKFERVSNAYPIYTLNYPRKLGQIVKSLRQYANVLNFGRTGGFWYNNQDHSIAVSMEIARSYLNDPDAYDANHFTFDRDFAGRG